MPDEINRLIKLFANDSKLIATKKLINTSQSSLILLLALTSSPTQVFLWVNKGQY